MMRTSVSDAEVGASGGLEELYIRHAQGGLRFAFYLTGDRDQAHDLVQEAFVRVAGRFRHRRGPDAFDAYLRRTILNLHASRLRRLRVERGYLGRARSGPDAHTDRDPAEHDAVWHVIQELPPRQRAAIVLRFYEDLSERRSAEVLGCSVGALNQLVARAMGTLRARIGEDDR